MPPPPCRVSNKTTFVQNALLARTHNYDVQSVADLICRNVKLDYTGLILPVVDAGVRINEICYNSCCVSNVGPLASSACIVV